MLIVDAIKHYQRSIDKHQNDNERLLHCISKLSNLPITFDHLNETKIGKTINALKKNGGEVEKAARVLVKKWIDLAEQHNLENDEKSEREDEQQMIKENNDDDKNSLKLNEDETKQRHHHHHHKKHKKESKRKKEHCDNDDVEMKKSRIDGVNKHSSKYNDSLKYFVKKGCDDDDDDVVAKNSSHLTEEKRKSDNKKRGEMNSRDVKKKQEKMSDKQKPNNVKKMNSFYIDSDDDDNDGDDNKRRSMLKEDNLNEQLSSSKLTIDQKENKSKQQQYNNNNNNNNHLNVKQLTIINERKREDDDDDRKKKKREEGEGSSYKKHKDKRKNDDGDSKRKRESIDKQKLDGEGRRESIKKEKRGENNDGDDQHKKLNEQHKKKQKKKRDMQEKQQEKDAFIRSCSEQQNQRTNSSNKLILSDLNFGDNDDDHHHQTKQKNRKQKMVEETKPKESFSNNNTYNYLESDDDDDDSRRLKVGEGKRKKAMMRMGIDVGGEAAPKLNIDLDLPEIMPEYKPPSASSRLATVWAQQQMTTSTNRSINNLNNSSYDDLSFIINQKNQKTKVYSGNKSYGYVASLFELCMRILQDNIDSLAYTGGVPYYILKPVLERATPDQLFMLEHHNAYLLDDTDELWKIHCNREFRNQTRQELESWRDAYQRFVFEREQKLQALTANIKESIIKQKLPQRQTKLAYVEGSFVKPPRNIRKKQEKYGSRDYITKPSIAAVGSPASRVPALAGLLVNSNLPSQPTKPLNTTTTNSNSKAKKAPLMKKMLSILKSSRFRR